MFKCISLGRWLVLPLALLFFSTSNVSAQINLDLRASAGLEGTINGAIFRNTDDQSTGTGVIQSFVRISAANQDAVEGYNTNFRPLQYDENSSPTFTRALPLGAIPTVTIGGMVYREFLLDINQTNNNPDLTMNELQIFKGNTGSPNGATKNANGTLSFDLNTTLIYDMDFGQGAGDLTTNRVQMNYSLNSGSGSGDLFVYVLDSLFMGADFVTLYSKFGPEEFANNDGFEEWAARTPEGGPELVPEPATIIAAVSGLPFGLLALRRRFRKNGDATA